MPLRNQYATANGAPRLINRVLEVNWCHVSLDDMQKVASWSRLIAEYREGWLFHLDVREDGTIILRHETEAEVREAGASEAFVDLLRLAVLAQCFLLRIHRDGEIYSDYPQFQW